VITGAKGVVTSDERRLMTDLEIAQKYVSKAQLAKQSNIPFELNFTSFKNLCRAKKCGYTGVTLTRKRSGKSSRATDLSIERIDNSQGYVAGNVIAVCHAANQLKAVFESNNNPLTPVNVRRMMDKLIAIN